MFKKITSLVLSILLASSFVFFGCIQKKPPKPPVAAVKTVVDTIHNTTLSDDYSWLRNREDEAVIKYLESENEYTEAMTEHTSDLQTDIYNELMSRIQQTDQSARYRLGKYNYYSRTNEGQDYKIYCRTEIIEDATEEIILDVNLAAEGYDFYGMYMHEVSPDGNLLAYAFDSTGREKYTILFKDLQTGQMLADTINNAYAELVWALDNKTVFYSKLDTCLRPYQVYRHTLGTKASDDQLVYQEDDELFHLELSSTKSNQFVLIELGSSTTTEVHYLDASKPEEDFKLFSPRRHKVEYFVYHHADNFFIITNENALNYKIMSTPINKTNSKNWKDFIPYNENIRINSLSIFENYMVISEREAGLDKFEVLRFRDGERSFIPFDESVYSTYSSNNYDISNQVFQYKYSSMITPGSVYEYNFTDKTSRLIKQDKIPAGHDKTQYHTERIYAKAADGTKIPITLVHKKSLKKDSSNPLYLYAYGSYGSTSSPSFRNTSFPLIDHGFIYAIAHIRGGGLLGKGWHEDGRMLNKKNSFTDFINCTEHLIEQKYTNPDLIAVSGGSAGGLLMGAIANIRPDLFKVINAGVPFVDVINTMLDASIPLTVIEYEEWGNPNIKEYFDYMMSYSPYDNVTAKAYPHMLITAGLNDARVQYWEPAKWTAKLRKLKTDNNTLLLKTNMGAGHGGGSGRYEYYDQLAFRYAFIFDKLGIDYNK